MCGALDDPYQDEILEIKRQIRELNLSLGAPVLSDRQIAELQEKIKYLKRREKMLQDRSDRRTRYSRP